MTAEKVGASGDIAICQSFETHFLTHGLIPPVFEQHLHDRTENVQHYKHL
jgi:hypothetical protein